MIRALLAASIVLFVRALLKTLRVSYIGETIDQPGVVAFLHGEQLPLLLNRPTHFPLVSPISLSRDGDLQVAIMRRFKIAAIRGSSSRGALGALRGLLRWLKEERGVALIAVDGQRGPYGKISPGALFIANHLNLPLWCCYVKCSKAITLSSWDHFIIPLPFSKLEIHTYRCQPTEQHLAEHLLGATHGEN